MALLKDFAQLMRSKNAGPFLLTIDVMFPTLDDYRHVVESGVLSQKVVGDLLGVEAQRVQVYLYEPAMAVKITLPRRLGVGDPADDDLFGGQQFGPLALLPVPDRKDRG